MEGTHSLTALCSSVFLFGLPVAVFQGNLNSGNYGVPEKNFGDFIQGRAHKVSSMYHFPGKVLAAIPRTRLRLEFVVSGVCLFPAAQLGKLVVLVYYKYS